VQYLLIQTHKEMETQKEHPVMVPYDFTSVSDVVLTHAGNYCRISNRPLMVLNIVDNSTRKFLKQQNLVEKNLEAKLEEICQNLSSKFNISASFIIRKTNILSIRKIAAELNISFMFIGIDQPQRSASKVLKLIGTSPAPVYVLQGDVEWKPFKTIIFPVDEFEETRQKINLVYRLAKLTATTVKLFSITLNKRDYQINQEVRVKQIERKLLDNKIPFTTEYAKLKQENFANELLDYTQANRGDVLILMKTPRVYFPNLYISKFDKKILLNSHNIPSIYINARDVETSH